MEILEARTRPYIVAEIGINHDGDPVRAEALIRAAAQAGADCVKFQAFRPETLVRTRVEILEKTSFPYEKFNDFKELAESLSLDFMLTPFDIDAVAVAAQGVAIKIGSGDLDNGPLLAAAAATGKPIVLSTGMSDLTEVERSLEFLARHGARDVVLLHCTSSYPAPYEDANLRAMETLSEAFGLPVGLSDHTPGIDVALAAAALGAVLIEKHFTLDKSAPGPDHAASIEPQELAALVQGVERISKALGDGVKRVRPSEEKLKRLARRGLYAARDLPQGHVIQEGDLIPLRPREGIDPMEFENVVGRVTARAISRGEPLRWEDLE